eukprot:maker-scaffold192_size271026-snap-gene-0.16 protein:Tk07196 transcript:maker-scaffold192_size271026-snap-gene-0.16-mRNA-1 annotation:"protein crebrf homolog isoform x1"
MAGLAALWCLHSTPNICWKPSCTHPEEEISKQTDSEKETTEKPNDAPRQYQAFVYQHLQEHAARPPPQQYHPSYAHHYPAQPCPPASQPTIYHHHPRSQPTFVPQRLANGGFVAVPTPRASWTYPRNMSSQGIKIEDDNSVDFDSSLMFDLNELLKRDPNLSSLQNAKEESNYFNTSALPIPPKKSPLHNPMLEPSLFNELDDVLATSASSPTSVNTFGSSLGSSISPAAQTSTSPSSMYAPASTPVFGLPNVTIPRNSSLVKMECDYDTADDSQQPTLTMLNSPDVSESSLLKLELNDLDVDFNQYFINDSSRDVSFGAPHYNHHPSGTAHHQTSSSGSGVGRSSSIAAPQPTTSHSVFLPTVDQSLFSTSSFTSHSGGSAFGSKDPLSSSVPSNIFQNSPLSDILSDFHTSSSNHGQASSARASPSVSPNLPSHSPSHAGPERHHSQLHKLLLRRDPVGGRPSPVRSPDSRQSKATLERIRTSLSHPSPQQLSKSAPSQQSYLERMWSRREPRQHISSVCSVGNDSSLLDEVSEALSGTSPSELPDIESDDEDDEDEGSQRDGRDTIGDMSSDEEDSDDEDGGQASSVGSQGKKKERHFWQYNVQAKGPKGQKIVVETKIEDPHYLNEIVDPVFSGNVQMQGIKHSGKARRGDGNDLTANPKKLAAIGKELEHLSRVINDLAPPSEMPFTTRCKSRKEKNKLASRACRLKKKAQHEANKLKCHGLEEEHCDLSNMIVRAKEILQLKVDPANSTPQADLTNEMDLMVKKSARNRVAGQTTEYVNKKIATYMKKDLYPGSS